MSNWDEIKNAVEKNENVLTITMEQLRDAHGSAKLGVHVRTEISSTLAGMGLGMFLKSFLATSMNRFVCIRTVLRLGT